MSSAIFRQLFQNRMGRKRRNLRTKRKKRNPRRKVKSPRSGKTRKVNPRNLRLGRNLSNF